MHDLFENLLAHGPVVTDGAFGTMLQQRGLPVGEPPDAWNLNHPEVVTAVARAYVDAGSAVVLTNTFGANALRLVDSGLADEALAINRAGVELSRRAAGDRARVFASIGPSGKLLLHGDVTEDELRAAFAAQASALAAAGADALVVETMSDLAEAECAVAAARATGLPVVACMVFDSGPDRCRTMMGDTPEQVAKALTAMGVDALGANCGQGVAGFVPICRRLRTATTLPLWIKANAGLPVLDGGRVVYPEGPVEFAARVPDLVAAGACFVGGCCGTDPAFVAAIAARLRGPS